jgi:hypothetical protein
LSKIEVDAVEPQSGTSLTLGASGDTITIPAGATFDSSAATTTLPATVVTTTGTQTLSNKTIDATQLTDSTVTLAKLSATGTQDATTFLRGDNTFATPAGGTNTPAFSATMSGSQSFSNTTSTKVDFDTETFDTAGAYDPTTNQRFTVPAGQGGKYYIHGKIFYNDQASTDAQRKIHIYKNGVNIGTGQSRTVGTTGRDATVEVSAILPLVETDYIEIYLYTNGGAGTLNGSYNNDVFEGFKIIE